MFLQRKVAPKTHGYDDSIYNLEEEEEEEEWLPTIKNITCREKFRLMYFYQYQRQKRTAWFKNQPLLAAGAKPLRKNLGKRKAGRQRVKQTCQQQQPSEWNLFWQLYLALTTINDWILSTVACPTWKKGVSFGLPSNRGTICTRRVVSNKTKGHLIDLFQPF